jgi:hypothetical protein
MTDERPVQANAPIFSPNSFEGGDFTLNDLFASGGTTDTDEAQVDLDWDAFGFVTADILPETSKSDLPRFHEPAQKVMPNGPFPLGNISPW